MRLLGFAFWAWLLVLPEASASPAQRVAPATQPLPAPTARLVDSAPQLAPLGFIQFCGHFESQCRNTVGPGEITLTPEIWMLLRMVNSQVNRAIVPNPAKGSLDWSLQARTGNCNDYAVQKQKALVDAGLPRSALPLSVVETPWGEPHLVLGVRTNRGDFVLDNLHAAPMAWHELNYRWIKRQSQSDIRIWVSINTRAGGDRPRPAVLEGLDTLTLRLSSPAEVGEVDEASLAPEAPPLRGLITPTM